MKYLAITFIAFITLFFSFAMACEEEEPVKKVKAVNPRPYNGIPILMMHGIMGSFHDFDLMHDVFKQKLPNLLTIPLDVDNGLASIGNLYGQLADMQKKITELQNQYKFDKFHLICHSQGGLLCRSLAATWSGHQIQKLVILSSPLVGQYGVPPAPFLPDPLKGITTAGAHAILYTSAAQNLFSVANFWKDPLFYNDYLNSNKFLSRLYNESTTPDDIHNSFLLKSNFLRIQSLTLFASDGDEVIIPWQSAHLAFWERGTTNKLVAMEDQEFYRRDYCGFATLKNQGRLSLRFIKGKAHTDWIRDTNLIISQIVPLFA